MVGAQWRVFLALALGSSLVAGSGAIVVDDNHCVGADTFVADVAARVDVAADDDGRVIRVAFGDGGHAVVITLDVDGARQGERRLGPFAGCDDAVAAALLATTLVIDPLAPPTTTTTIPPPPRTPPPTTATTSPTTPTTPAPPPEAAAAAGPAPLPVGTDVSVAVGGGVGSGFGVVPGPMGLVRLRVDTGVWGLVVGAGARVDLPTSQSIAGDKRLETVGGALFVEACSGGDVGAGVVVDVCSLGEGGGMRATAFGVDNAVPVTPRLITAGLSASLRVPLWAGLGAFVRVGATAPVLRAQLFADGAQLWESPPLAVQLAVGVDGVVATHERRPGR